MTMRTSPRQDFGPNTAQSSGPYFFPRPILEVVGTASLTIDVMVGARVHLTGTAPNSHLGGGIFTLMRPVHGLRFY